MTKNTKAVHLERFVAPRVASKLFGVTTQTLRNWAKKGRISFITLPSGHRHYNVDALLRVMAPPNGPDGPSDVGSASEAPRGQPGPSLLTAPLHPAVVDNPLALALARLLTERPADAPAQILALLGAGMGETGNSGDKPAAKPVTRPARVDVRAAIEAIAGQV